MDSYLFRPSGPFITINPQPSANSLIQPRPITLKRIGSIGYVKVNQ